MEFCVWKAPLDTPHGMLSALPIGRRGAWSLEFKALGFGLGIRV